MGQGERRGERKERTTPSSSRVDSNAGDISTNQITPRAPPFIIILLVFPLLHPHWMTFSGPFRGAKKLPAPNRRLHDSSFGTLLVPTLVHGPPPQPDSSPSREMGRLRRFHAFPRISNSFLLFSLYLSLILRQFAKTRIDFRRRRRFALSFNFKPIDKRSVVDRWFFTRFSLVAKKVTLRVVDPWRARDRIVKLLRALRDFILFRFILFPFFSLSFFLSSSSRYGKSWERTRSVANAREFSMSKTCSIHRLGDPNESESTMKASGW